MRRDRAPDEHGDDRPAVAEVSGPLLDAAFDVFDTVGVTGEFWVAEGTEGTFSLVRLGYDRRARFVPAASGLLETPETGAPLAEDPESLEAACGSPSVRSGLWESLVERFLVGRDAWEVHRS